MSFTDKCLVWRTVNVDEPIQGCHRSQGLSVPSAAPLSAHFHEANRALWIFTCGRQSNAAIRRHSGASISKRPTHAQGCDALSYRPEDPSAFRELKASGHSHMAHTSCLRMHLPAAADICIAAACNCLQAQLWTRQAGMVHAKEANWLVQHILSVQYVDPPAHGRVDKGCRYTATLNDPKCCK